MRYEIKSFGGCFSEIFIYNDQTMVSFSDLGARINRWQTADGDDIILGHDNYQHVLEGTSYYFGATIGRVAGRLSEGRYGDIQLPLNSEGQHLHGGDKAFDLTKWDFEVKQADDRIIIIFSLRDPAGKNNYPGNLKAEVIHTYNKDNEWKIEYRAHTDEETLFNPTNHVYFNLNGDNQSTIHNHYLSIKADRFLPIKEGGLPVGIKAPVKGTVFDLNKGVLLEDILKNETEEQLTSLGGLDHPFELTGEEAYDGLLSIKNPDRKIWMKTDRPAVVIYSLNSVGQPIDIWGKALAVHHGIALETQVLPDALKHKDFGEIILKPQEVFYSQTTYRLEEG